MCWQCKGSRFISVTCCATVETSLHNEIFFLFLFHKAIFRLFYTLFCSMPTAYEGKNTFGRGVFDLAASKNHMQTPKQRQVAHRRWRIFRMLYQLMHLDVFMSCLFMSTFTQRLMAKSIRDLIDCILTFPVRIPVPSCFTASEQQSSFAI